MGNNLPDPHWLTPVSWKLIHYKDNVDNEYANTDEKASVYQILQNKFFFGVLFTVLHILFKKSNFNIFFFHQFKQYFHPVLLSHTKINLWEKLWTHINTYMYTTYLHIIWHSLRIMFHISCFIWVTDQQLQNS